MGACTIPIWNIKFVTNEPIFLFFVSIIWDVEFILKKIGIAY